MVIIIVSAIQTLFKVQTKSSVLVSFESDTICNLEIMQIFHMIHSFRWKIGNLFYIPNI